MNEFCPYCNNEDVVQLTQPDDEGNAEWQCRGCGETFEAPAIIVGEDAEQPTSIDSRYPAHRRA